MTQSSFEVDWVRERVSEHLCSLWASQWRYSFLSGSEFWGQFSCLLFLLVYLVLVDLEFVLYRSTFSRVVSLCKITSMLKNTLLNFLIQTNSADSTLILNFLKFLFLCQKFWPCFESFGQSKLSIRRRKFRPIIHCHEFFRIFRYAYSSPSLGIIKILLAPSGCRPPFGSYMDPLPPQSLDQPLSEWIRRFRCSEWPPGVLMSPAAGADLCMASRFLWEGDNRREKCGSQRMQAGERGRKLAVAKCL